MPYQNQQQLRQSNVNAFTPLPSLCCQINVTVPRQIQGNLWSSWVQNKVQRTHPCLLVPSLIQHTSRSLRQGDKAQRKENQNTHIWPPCSSPSVSSLGRKRSGVFFHLLHFISSFFLTLAKPSWWVGHFLKLHEDPMNWNLQARVETKRIKRLENYLSRQCPDFQRYSLIE